MPQVSVLGPLLFLIYINDWNGVSNFSKIHHFADDTNILYASNSLNDINKKINCDLKSIAEWLKANKISLNSGKTELVLFRSKGKKVTKNMNFRISGQKINMISQTKYFELILDEHLIFKYHLQNLKLKVNRAYFLLSKVRYYVKFPLLWTICYALFDSHLRYGCQIWGQRRNEYIESIEKTQNKAIRILNFTGPGEEAEKLYKQSKTDKVRNIIIITNCRFVYDQLWKKLPENFSDFFTLNTQLHHHNTRGNKLIVPNVNTTIYGSNSIRLKAIKQWNELLNLSKQISFLQKWHSKLVKSIKTYIEKQSKNGNYYHNTS